MFEAVDYDGNMIVIDYNGRRGMVASWCCRELPDAPDASASQASPAVVEQAPAPHRHGGHRWRSGGFALPQWAASLLALFMLFGVVVGFWQVFGPDSCHRFFDRIAGDYVTDCSTLAKFRPAILFFGTGAVAYFTGSVPVALGVGLAYEIILVIFRAKALESFRAAAAEALYIGLNAIRVMALLAVFVILAGIAASGGSKSRSGGGGDSGASGGDSCGCDTCSHYKGCNGITPMAINCSQGQSFYCPGGCPFHSR